MRTTVEPVLVKREESKSSSGSRGWPDGIGPLGRNRTIGVGIRVDVGLVKG